MRSGHMVLEHSDKSIEVERKNEYVPTSDAGQKRSEN